MGVVGSLEFGVWNVGCGAAGARDLGLLDFRVFAESCPQVSG